MAGSLAHYITSPLPERRPAWRTPVLAVPPVVGDIAKARVVGALKLSAADAAAAKGVDAAHRRDARVEERRGNRRKRAAARVAGEEEAAVGAAAAKVVAQHLIHLRPALPHAA